MQTQKLTFQEAWDSATIFFVEEKLEDEIDVKVGRLLELSQSSYLTGDKEHSIEDIIAFLFLLRESEFPQHHARQSPGIPILDTGKVLLKNLRQDVVTASERGAGIITLLP